MKYVLYVFNYFVISGYFGMLLLIILNNFASIDPGPFLEINTNNFAAYSITTIGWGEPMSYFKESYPWYLYFVEIPFTAILPILLMIYFLRKYPNLNLNKKFIFSKLGIVNIVALLILIPVVGSQSPDLKAVPEPKYSSNSWSPSKKFSQTIYELDDRVKEEILNTCINAGEDAFLYGLEPMKDEDYIILKDIWPRQSSLTKFSDEENFKEQKVNTISDFNKLIDGDSDSPKNNLQIVCFKDQEVYKNLIKSYREVFDLPGISNGRVGETIVNEMQDWNWASESRINVAAAEAAEERKKQIDKRIKLRNKHHRWVSNNFLNGNYCELLSHIDSISIKYDCFPAEGIL